MSVVENNAILLNKFSDASWLKFLTHGFDLPDEADFVSYLASCRSELLDNKGKIDDSLYRLLFGFMYGPSWNDYSGKEHHFYCSSEDCVSWCLEHPGQHPKDNSLFAEEFEDFRHSTRLYQLDLEKHVRRLFAEKFRDLTLEAVGLKRANVYINVPRLMSILERIISTMQDARFSHHKLVRVSFEKGAPEGAFQIGRIIIEHVGSLPPYTPVNSLANRIARGGGDLGSIKKLVEGTCLWSIESVWYEGPARLNIVGGDTMVERLDEDVTGFRHILTLIHNTL